ncbi:hypothetical protein MBANPS3_003972, partial [Mucor bainieri]
MLTEKLPLELLGHVLSFISSLKDLAQCRLVCKHLNLSAQRAMLSKPITISSISEAKALLYHLENNKEMGKLITSLEIKKDKDNKTDEVINLLPLVFTPAMKSFKGYIKKPEFFQRLIDIAKASGTTFNNLQVIPDPSYNCMNEYYKAILHFKNTLQHVHIYYQYTTNIPWHVFNQFGEFVNLTSLDIDGDVETVQDLNRMLAPCSRLQELKMCAYGMLHEAMNEADLLDWMEEQHVEQVNSLTKVEIQGAEQPDIAEYLVYKYPNMKEVSVFLGSSEYYEERIHYNWDPIWVEEPETAGIHRIIDALQKVPVYRFYYMAGIIPSVLEEIEKHVMGTEPCMVTMKEKIPRIRWMEMEVVNSDYNDDSSD